MGAINTGRVIGGGLLAGLIFNVGESLLNAVVLAGPMEESSAAHNLSEPGGGAIALFVLMGFLYGIVLVWLYAAARPRLGPGPKTAACIASVVWLVAYLFPLIGWAVFDMMPWSWALLAVVWGLVETILAAMAGCAVYKEA